MIFNILVKNKSPKYSSLISKPCNNIGLSVASLQLIFSWIYCPDEIKASPDHIYLCSADLWYHTTDIHQMVRVPQNIFFWNASAVFGTYFSDTHHYIWRDFDFYWNLYCILTSAPQNSTSNTKLPCLNFKQISSNFISEFSKFAGGQAPSTTLHYTFTRGAEQRPQNPVSLVCCQPWEPNSLLWTPK